MILLGKGLKGEIPLLFAAGRGLEAIVEVLLVGSGCKGDLTWGWMHGAIAWQGEGTRR